MTDDFDRPTHAAPLWHTRGPSDLLAGWTAAMASVPDLPGAACKGSAEWDYDHDQQPETLAEREARLDAAVAACHGCPVLEVCRRYVDGLPPRERPTGAIAGRVIAPGGRERRVTKPPPNHTAPPPNGAQRAARPATASKEASV
jgi:hypothetical protein